MLDSLRSLLRPRFAADEPEDQETETVADIDTNVTMLTPKPLPPKIGAMGDRATEAVEKLTSDLTDWFAVDLNALVQAWNRLSDKPNDPLAVNELFRACHNLAGADTLYNRPYVSRICRSLAKLIARGKIRADMSLMALHVDACRAIGSDKDTRTSASKVCEALEAEVSKLIID